jgi:hypothetical protein
MAESITCICGYRGPSVPEGDFQVCPICRGRVRGSGWSGLDAASEAAEAAEESAESETLPAGFDDDDDDSLRPEEPTIYRIPCPQGHVLKAREDMLGEQVCCPHCNEFFVLRATDSVEFRRRQAKLRTEAEERAAQAWLKRAIWAAVIIGVSFIIMLVISLNPGLIRR